MIAATIPCTESHLKGNTAGDVHSVCRDSRNPTDRECLQNLSRTIARSSAMVKFSSSRTLTDLPESRAFKLVAMVQSSTSTHSST